MNVEIFRHKDMAISLCPLQFSLPSYVNQESSEAKEALERLKKYYEALNRRLDTIDLDMEMQQNIIKQVSSAINKYPQEQRIAHHNFNPIAFFMDFRDESKFIVANLEGNWNRFGSEFILKYIQIVDYRSVNQLSEIISTTYNRDRIRQVIYSDDFDQVFNGKR